MYINAASVPSCPCTLYSKLCTVYMYKNINIMRARNLKPRYRCETRAVSEPGFRECKKVNFVDVHY